MRPNVLVVMSDQQRPDSCGVFGQRLDVTPNLDALASRGVAFDNAFTIQPVCGPSRSAMQTGRYPTSTGTWRNGLALPDGIDTVADVMARAGYATGYVGKWHLGSNRGPRLSADRIVERNERGPVPPARRGGYRDVWLAADAIEHTSGAYGGHVFDENGQRITLDGYRVDALTDLAIERIDSLPRDRPFFMWVSFLEPHHQNDRFRVIGPKGWAKRFGGFDLPGDLPRWRGDWRWNYAEYLAACASIDANLGRLLDTLTRRGDIDNTVVIYTSDHGSHFRTRNLEYKRSCHDASLRIPLVVAGPGFDGPSRRDELVCVLDLLPTIATVAGTSGSGTAGTAGSGTAAGTSSSGIDGIALQTPDDRRDLLVQISESQIGRALRTDRYTLGVRAPTRNLLAGHLRSASGRYRVTHLYDNLEDPHQRHNLADSSRHRERRELLAHRLSERILQVEGAIPAITTM